MKPETPVKRMSFKGRRQFASACKQKRNQLYVPGVTAVTEVGEEEDSDDNRSLKLRGTSRSPQKDDVFNCQSKQALYLTHNGKSADLSRSVCKSARNVNYDFKNLTEKNIGKQIDNMKVYKETKLQAEKAELKVLKYKRLFHQVNQKLQNQSKLYTDQLARMSDSLDEEQLNHA